MKGKLSGKELTGLLFLLLIIAIIVACSLALKQCRQQDPAPQVMPNVEMQKEAADNDDGYSSGGSRKRKKSSGRRGGRKASSSKGTAAKEKAAIPDRDPFEDTIPTEY